MQEHEDKTNDVIRDHWKKIKKDRGFGSNGDSGDGWSDDKS